jgi:hypothetical protein
MTPDEATQIVFEQFTGEAGFIIDLRMGRGFNYAAIARVRQALDTLQQAWKNQACVPKNLVIHMIDVRSAILSSWGLYPDLQHELESLADEMMERVRGCLS